MLCAKLSCKDFLNFKFSQFISLFCNYLPLKRGMTSRTNLNPLFRGMFYSKSSWNRPSGSGLEVDNVTDIQTDGRTNLRTGRSNNNIPDLPLESITTNQDASVCKISRVKQCFFFFSFMYKQLNIKIQHYLVLVDFKHQNSKGLRSAQTGTFF